jgi:hypothetical protein
MHEESTTPGLVEMMRLAFEATNRGDLDSAVSIYAPDAVWDASVNGLGVFEGPEAIRGFMEDWQGTYEDYVIEAGGDCQSRQQRRVCRLPGERSPGWQWRSRSGTALPGRRVRRCPSLGSDVLPAHRRGPCCRRTQAA